MVISSVLLLFLGTGRECSIPSSFSVLRWSLTWRWCVFRQHQTWDTGYEFCHQDATCLQANYCTFPCLCFPSSSFFFIFRLQTFQGYGHDCRAPNKMGSCSWLSFLCAVALQMQSKRTHSIWHSFISEVYHFGVFPYCTISFAPSKSLWMLKCFWSLCVQILVKSIKGDTPVVKR